MSAPARQAWMCRVDSGLLRPQVLEQAPALLEGGDGEDPAPDPLAVSG
jgi:hypothetical protein